MITLNVFKLKTLIKWALVSLLVILLWPPRGLISTDENIHTRRFCAYGQVYVEFEHAGKTWGTTFLGVSGNPVTCDENDTVSTPASTSERI